MPSPSDPEFRPPGNHRAPRRTARLLTKRRVTISPERLKEIDLHHLGSALLRLAQEDFDVVRASGLAATEQGQAGAPVRPHEAVSRAEAARPPSGPPARSGSPHGADA